MDLHQIAYNAGLEIRYAVAASGRDPIHHIPEVDAIIERRLAECRREALDEFIAALSAHELYRYRPKAFKGFFDYIRALSDSTPTPLQEQTANGRKEEG